MTTQYNSVNTQHIMCISTQILAQNLGGMIFYFEMRQYLFERARLGTKSFLLSNFSKTPQKANLFPPKCPFHFTLSFGSFFVSCRLDDEKIGQIKVRLRGTQLYLGSRLKSEHQKMLFCAVLGQLHFNVFMSSVCQITAWQ